jgi:DNA-binding transcriptional regulator YiaG
MSVSVPECVEMKTSPSGEKYVAFNVCLSGRLVCSRRYKEFDVFHSLLKREFPDFSFPSLPSKWPFKLSEQQLDARRRGLESYLDKICSVKIIFETQIVKDFLCLSETNMVCNFSGICSNNNHNNNNSSSSSNLPPNQHQKLKPSPHNESPASSQNSHNNKDTNKNSNFKPASKVTLDDGDSATMSSNEYTITNGSINKVAQKTNLTQNEFSDLKVLLPDKSTLKLIKVKQSSTADEVYEKVLEKLHLDDLHQYYYLFEIIDQSFERKLRPHESPILINLQNDSKSTCISLRKWYFNLKSESLLAKNPTTLKFLFAQACDDVDRAQISLQSLQTDIDVNFFRENSRHLDFVKNVYKCDGYGDTIFPHCPCDSRKHGHVIVVLSYTSFKLKACSREGDTESQVVEFDYEDIERVDVDDDEMSFIIEVKVKGKANRKIKIYTGFYLYMYDCLLKAKQDHQDPT